jgi:hypothetical protein
MVAIDFLKSDNASLSGIKIEIVAPGAKTIMKLKFKRLAKA